MCSATAIRPNPQGTHPEQGESAWPCQRFGFKSHRVPTLSELNYSTGSSLLFVQGAGSCYFGGANEISGPKEFANASKQIFPYSESFSARFPKMAFWTVPIWLICYRSLN